MSEYKGGLTRVPFRLDSIISGDFRLEPFSPERHATAFWEGSGPDPKLYAYMRYGPCVSKEDFVRRFTGEGGMRPQSMLYAIVTTRQPAAIQTNSKTRPGEEALAGIAGFQDGSPVHLSVEIGPMLLLPKYHGVGLATDVTRLMGQHALDDVSRGGLGLRRVVYVANSANVASIRAAKKAGFRHEAVLRWHHCYRDGQARGKIGNGRALPPGSDLRDIGRDSVFMARCWDDEQANQKLDELDPAPSGT